MTKNERYLAFGGVLILGAISFATWELQQSNRVDETPTRGDPPITMKPSPTAPVSERAIPDMPRSQSRDTIDARMETIVGQAGGSVQFTLPASGGLSEGVVEFKPSSSVGLWLPAEKRVRIAMLDHAPDYTEASRMMQSLADRSSLGSRGQPHAEIEIAFRPTAQAFTPDEVDSAKLILVDRDGRNVEVDITNGFDWNAALAAPEVSTDATRLELKSSGSAPSQNPSRDQAWQIAATLPVAMRQ